MLALERGGAEAPLRSKGRGSQWRL